MVAVLIPIIAVTLSLMIPIVAIIVDYFNKKNKAQVVQRAIENGVPIENLQLEEPKQRLPYRGGMVCMAVGIGLAIFGFAIGTYTPDQEAMPVFLGIGALIALIGLALLINDRMNYDKYFKDQ